MEIRSLQPEHLTRFIDRIRRFETESYESYLHGLLVNVLSELSEFVPCQGAFVYLDDPEQKRFPDRPVDLVYVSGFGTGIPQVLGKRVSSTLGAIGETYTLGKSLVRKENTKIDRKNLPVEFKEFISVPLKIESSVVGVLLLHDKKDPVGFTIRDLKLVEIFAGYLSTSFQNAIDARKSRELSKRDDLTGLFNDRYFHRHLEIEIGVAEDKKTPLSLMFMDLDNFKSINDQYGHLVGSQTLKEIGLILREVVESPTATLARYGGDEYVVILPGVTAVEAGKIADRIRQMIHAKLFMIDLGEADGSFVNFKGVLSCSVGIASLHEHVPPSSSLRHRKNLFIRQADQAMYKAKERGKNCFVIAEQAKTEK